MESTTLTRPLATDTALSSPPLFEYHHHRAIVLGSRDTFGFKIETARWPEVCELLKDPLKGGRFIQHLGNPHSMQFVHPTEENPNYLGFESSIVLIEQKDWTMLSVAYTADPIAAIISFNLFTAQTLPVSESGIRITVSQKEGSYFVTATLNAQIIDWLMCHGKNQHIHHKITEIVARCIQAETLAAIPDNFKNICDNLANILRSSPREQVDLLVSRDPKEVLAVLAVACHYAELYRHTHHISPPA